MPVPPTQDDLDQLAEPTRSKAREVFQRLLSRGVAEARAIELAFRQAEEWETSRHPGTRPPFESPHMAEVRLTGPEPADTGTAPGDDQSAPGADSRS